MTSKKLLRRLQSSNIVNILMKEANLKCSVSLKKTSSATCIFLRGDLEEVVEKNTEFES